MTSIITIIIIATMITLLTITINYHDKVEQREEGEAVSADSLALVQRYNDIIASLTEAFFQVGMRGKIIKIIKVIKAFLLTRVIKLQADIAITKAEKEAGIISD